ncbi:DUF4249 domain-containing protein [Mucilaginibacter daejeonensis]|uniref:DUF4249 domain-containing protein n=1 Tax=Mucilaginibacter daejeonensis TaxID=398049 RepID=UPI001D17269E|nr:DUF4249 domain-containing protein [Mucilaginibacter daejeonensis]UEG52426.1 DUF4249 domain-containing protein [Mucilaginibacter daejeonensis]
MKRTQIIYLLVAIAMVTITCKETYTPPDTNINTNWLVVEGNINTGNDSTIIKLSRTVKLTASTAIKPELNATLTIESNTNNNYTLTQKGNGVYYTVPLALDPNKQYRLRIRTSDNKQYLSDYVVPKVTPAIDEVTWKADDASLKIYNNTHDATGKARYYKWDFSETYQFISAVSSSWKSDGKQIVARNFPADDITTCWKTVESTTIGLGSSVKLTQDVIKDNLLTTVPSSEEKVSYKYSILVKQYALNKDAFEFWERLKKNTEQLGSIFDAQPSMLQSNIHNVTTPTEPVIGYLSACNVTTKRIFVSASELPSIYSRPRYSCPLDTFYFRNPNTRANDVTDILIPKFAIPAAEYTHPETGAVIGYTGQRGNCIDCTLRGSNKRPAFWQ